MNHAEKELARRTLARRRLLYYTQRSHPSYEAGWVHDDICRRLERFSLAVVERKSPRLMLLMPPRHGKQIADSFQVLTPLGWKCHGELTPGDRVFHPSGKQVKVLAVSSPSRQDCEVEFTDGSRIRCHENHEWVAYDRAHSDWRTVDTKYLEQQALFSGGRARFQMPLVAELVTKHVEVPVDSYFLGAWLGDGKSSAPVICGTEADLDFIVGRIGYTVGARWVHKETGVHYQNFIGVASILRAAGVLNNKHIPSVYFTASPTQRRELLAGLVDTDGSVEPASQRVRFRSGSERLANDVAILVRTLGYRASVDYTPPDTRDRAIKGGASWCVQWTPHDGRGGGTLPRKTCARIRSRRRVGIKAIRRTPLEAGRCIQVDSLDGLYLVGEHLTPTHNSELASIRFPAWHLGHNPTHEIINVGYNLDLPMRWSRKVRECLRDPLYQAIFPTCTLDTESQGVEAWLTTLGGGFTAAGRGGGITGKGAHVLIVDDPLKNQEEADSALTRDSLWDWYLSTAYTRLAPGGGVLVIETWWNDDDLAGRIQKAALADSRADQFEVVKYPALAEAYEYRHKETLEIKRAPAGEEPTALILQAALKGSPDYEFLRQPGDALHAARYDAEALGRIKAVQSTRSWSALYQQNPVPDEGMFFKREYFKFTPEPAEPYDKYIITCWDFAITEKQQSDWTVGATIAVDHNATIYVLDINRFKADTFTIINAILDTAQRFMGQPGAEYWVGFEDGHIWKTLEPVLRRRMQERKCFPSFVEPLRPVTDKQIRARPLQGAMEQGRVYFPSSALWTADAQHELMRFPAGQHDDIVDALSWAVRVAVSKGQPQKVQAAAMKSWREKLAEQLNTDGSHMAA